MKSLITEPLGLYGWKQLEPVILAALATESPMLLIGKHGSAKSFILERLAEALKLNYRFYNASLINYDDLVGIPIPTEDKKSLTYITNKTSIWDAEVVFIDEINRTKYELQNKLFPIIYDKRVQGQDLIKLKYRWAAMNPPANDDEDDDNQYLGATALDPALVDRFSFIIKVPTWDDLSESDKTSMLSDVYNGRHEFPVDIFKLIEDTKKNIDIVKSDSFDKISKYVIVLMQMLENDIGYMSTRRAGILLETLIAIHAARITLAKYGEGKIEDIESSSLLHIRNTITYNAINDISFMKLTSICKEAWASVNSENVAYKNYMEIKEVENKLIYLLNNKNEFKVTEISDFLLTTIQGFDERKKRAAALVSFLSLKDYKEIPASTMETLTKIAEPCFTVIHNTTQESMGISTIFHQVVKETNSKSKKECDKYKSNLLNSFLPHGYDNANQVKELSEFYSYLISKVKING